jgi:hypothetical protein
MTNYVVDTVKGIITEIDYFLNDYHTEKPENYIKAEKQKEILIKTLEELNKIE